MATGFFYVRYRMGDPLFNKTLLSCNELFVKKRQKSVVGYPFVFFFFLLSFCGGVPIWQERNWKAFEDV